MEQKIGFGKRLIGDGMQRFATQDQWPQVPFVVEERMSKVELALHIVFAAMLGGFVIFGGYFGLPW